MEMERERKKSCVSFGVGTGAVLNVRVLSLTCILLSNIRQVSLSLLFHFSHLIEMRRGFILLFYEV